MLEFSQGYLILRHHFCSLILETIASRGQLIDFVMKIEIVLIRENRILLIKRIIGITLNTQTLHYNL